LASPAIKNKKRLEIMRDLEKRLYATKKGDKKGES